MYVASLVSILSLVTRSLCYGSRWTQVKQHKLYVCDLFGFHNSVPSNEVPILWVQVDPDYQWIRDLRLEQSDTTWMNVLRYDRSANTQLEALEALAECPSINVRDTFRDAIAGTHFYYQVRLAAAQKLAQVCMYVRGTISEDHYRACASKG